MNNKLLNDIYCHVARNQTSFKMEQADFYDALDENEQGKEMICDLWDEQHKEAGFPPKEQTIVGYFFKLMALGIITDYQYDILIGKL